MNLSSLFAIFLGATPLYVEADSAAEVIEQVIEAEQPALDVPRKWLSDTWPPVRIEPQGHEDRSGGSEVGSKGDGGSGAG